MVTEYAIILILLLVAEIIYFRIAERFKITDKPNERSSHTTVTLRGGGIIFLVGIWLYSIASGFQYPWFVAGLTLVAGFSFIDDIRSLPDSSRLIVQMVAAVLMLYQLGLPHWWIAPLALIVIAGAANVINFMDGINGITGAYSLAVLIPLALVAKDNCFVDQEMIVTTILASAVFCLFNLRPKGKAKCFAGDVGSIGIAFIMLFLIGRLIVSTLDPSWLIMLIVYGVDGCLTIVHRIMLHENLGTAHRKHAYQIMANELRIGHVKIALLYATIQLCISLGFIYLCPDSPLWHWVYLAGFLVLLAIAYVMFMKKYYHLHKEYLTSIKS